MHFFGNYRESFNKAKPSNQNEGKDEKQVLTEPEPEPEPEPETKPTLESSSVTGPSWIETTGYKAVDCNMKAFNGDLTYEVGKTYVLGGPVIPCERGYHFCKTLEDALELFPPRYGRRYFKVRALVLADTYPRRDGTTYCGPKSCQTMRYEDAMARYQTMKRNTGSTSFSYFWPPCISDFKNDAKKYVGKEITLLEEVPFEEFAQLAKNSIITTEEEYRTVTTYAQFRAQAQQKWLEETKGIFSECFSEYIFNTKVTISMKPGNSDCKLIQSVYDNLVNTLKIFKDEPISQDMKTLYMLRLTGVMK